MTRVEFDENGGWTAVPFDSEVIGRVCSTGLLESRVTASGAEVKPQLNRIGAIRIDGDEVVVHPKAAFSSVLFMLGYAADPGFRPEEVSGNGREIFPAVAETYVRIAERALGHGLLQGYRRYDESAMTVRGRVRFSDQMSRRGGRLLPIELTVDDYSADIVENRILRAAGRLLLTVPRVSPDVRRRLAHLDSRLSEAALLQPGTMTPSWQASRLNQRYQPALRFAELVLARTTPTTTSGGHAVASFVVNMAEAFEAFVTTTLSSALSEVSRGVSYGQFPAHLDLERRQPIRPDFVHVAGGRPVVVIDAKYKLGPPRVEDLYQMLAYCTVLGLSEGMLVYVSSAGDTSDRTTTVKGSGVVVRTARIDVTRPPAEMLAQLAGIGRAAVRRAEIGTPSAL
ncbi:restriction endonuclease [Rathayibacter sp. VKM Ac-2801]|uniref:McrC family protein n=1 Tax=Rathayibacter sp. VKM Ac-2801 TaxID=2609255 RepID=UPI0013204094|nr:restriction endonuclease [Rathayibacter sp. VKM Ac-2801]QHC71589.1 restriction endonuclease [Rathayibacter sp. VKM Ac-2801]